MDGVTCRFTKEISATNPVCYFKAGGAFMSVNGGTGDVANNQDWLFWPGDPLKCLPVREGTSGVCVFAFYYSPNDKNDNNTTQFFEPWKVNWDGKVETLYRECRNSSLTYNRPCASIIEYYGWKIPKDYPYKVRY